MEAAASQAPVCLQALAHAHTRTQTHTRTPTPTRTHTHACALASAHPAPKPVGADQKTPKKNYSVLFFAFQENSKKAKTFATIERKCEKEKKLPVLFFFTASLC